MPRQRAALSVQVVQCGRRVSGLTPRLTRVASVRASPAVSRDVRRSFCVGLARSSLSASRGSLDVHRRDAIILIQLLERAADRDRKDRSREFHFEAFLICDSNQSNQRYTEYTITVSRPSTSLQILHCSRHPPLLLPQKALCERWLSQCLTLMVASQLLSPACPPTSRCFAQRNE